MEIFRVGRDRLSFGDVMKGENAESWGECNASEDDWIEAEKNEGRPKIETTVFLQLLQFSDLSLHTLCTIGDHKRTECCLIDTFFSNHRGIRLEGLFIVSVDKVTQCSAMRYESVTFLL